MSLTIKELQSIIQNNRSILAILYHNKTVAKIDKRLYDDEGDLESEYLAHNELKDLSKQIAKLVSLQKSLKAAVRTEVANQRIYRKVDRIIEEVSNMKKEAMAQAGEIF